MSGFELKPLSVQRHLVWDLLRDTDPYYLNHQIFLIDFTTVDECRQSWADDGFEKPSYVASVLYGMTRILPDFPVFNAYLREWPLVRLALYENIDIAYTTEKPDDDGKPILTLSMLRDCGNLSFSDFLARFKEQKETSLEANQYRRTHKMFGLIPNFLRTPLFRLFCKPFPSIMRKIAGTVGFTSVGKDGVDFTTPLSPKSMTVSLGSVKKRPMARDDEVLVKNSAYITLTYDHRVADGRECARFGSNLRRFLEEEISHLKPKEK